jgi:hypothetical protein
MVPAEQYAFVRSKHKGSREASRASRRCASITRTYGATGSLGIPWVGLGGVRKIETELERSTD